MTEYFEMARDSFLMVDIDIVVVSSCRTASAPASSEPGVTLKNLSGNTAQHLDSD